MRGIILFAMLASLPLPGWAQSGVILDEPLSSTNTVLFVPEEGQISRASAGQDVLRTENARLAEGAILEVGVSSPPKSSPFSLTAGSALFRIASKSKFKACALVTFGEMWPPCLLDDDGDGTFDRGAANSARKAYPLEYPARYSRREIIMPPASSGFVRVLTYQGASSGSLKLGYKEFQNDLARAAFTEELLIPLTPVFPQKVAAKGVVFNVIEISGMGMKYEVLDSSGF